MWDRVADIVKVLAFPVEIAIKLARVGHSNENGGWEVPQALLLSGRSRLSVYLYMHKGGKVGFVYVQAVSTL